MRIAYIVSSSYSGSTLLSFILNAHPDIGTISEFDNMEAVAKDPDFLCSCGEKIRVCPFFAQVRQKMEAEGYAFAVDNMSLMLSLSQNERLNRLFTGKLPKLQSNNAEWTRDLLIRMIPALCRKKEACHDRTTSFMQAILDIKGASMFLDATKDPYRMLFLAERHDVNAIYLYKNGIGGAFSYMKAAAKSGHLINMAEAAKRWFEEQITILRNLRNIPADRQIKISYSNLCKSPKDTAFRLHQFLGLHTISIENFGAAPHHIIGNQMRLSGISAIKESEDWKNILKESEVNDYILLRRKYIGKLEQYYPGIEKNIWMP